MKINDKKAYIMLEVIVNNKPYVSREIYEILDGNQIKFEEVFDLKIPNEVEEYIELENFVLHIAKSADNEFFGEVDVLYIVLVEGVNNEVLWVIEVYVRVDELNYRVMSEEEYEQIIIFEL